MGIEIRSMAEEDWQTVARIYAEGIESGMATFETSVPTWADFDATRLRECRLVVEFEGKIVGWAALSAVSARHCYRGVAEFSIYLSEAARGQRTGTALLGELIRQSEASGIWTLQGTIFPENQVSIRLVERFGFRFVGRRERIAFHRGAWRSTVIYERRSDVVGV